MDKYEKLLKSIIDRYVDALTDMYFWDARCNAESNAPDADIMCRIRNDAAKRAGALYEVLAYEIEEDEIGEYHRIAKNKAQ